MPPKASVESAGEPRRSGRIASQPAAPVVEAKPKAPRATKKRSAEAVEGADAKATTAKKVKFPSLQRFGLSLIALNVDYFSRLKLLLIPKILKERLRKKRQKAPLPRLLLRILKLATAFLRWF